MSYSHIDGRVTARPLQGGNFGGIFEFNSQTKVTFDPGTKYKLVMGRRQRPLFTAIQSAEPKLSIEFSSAFEYLRWWRYLCAGGVPLRGQKAQVSHVFTRSDVGTMDFTFLRVSFPAPGYESGDNGVTYKVDLTLEDAHLFGVTIYEDVA